MTKLEQLRRELTAEVKKLEPGPNSLAIITPRLTHHKFTRQYVEFLQDSLSQAFPDLKWIILDDPLSIHSAGKPAESGEEYMRGWKDCLSSLVATKELEHHVEDYLDY